MTYRKKTVTKRATQILEKGKKEKTAAECDHHSDQRQGKESSWKNIPMSTARSLSDIMREALDSWKFKRNRLCMEE